MQRVAQKLMDIKAVFPEADAASVFLQRPNFFLATSSQTLEESVARLQDILPDVNINKCAPQSANLNFQPLLGRTLTMRPCNENTLKNESHRGAIFQGMRHLLSRNRNCGSALFFNADKMERDLEAQRRVCGVAG